MKKLIEKIKLFWTSKVVPVLATIKKIWKVIIAFTVTREFELTFPLAIFGMSALVLHNFIFVLVSLIWLIPCIHEINHPKE
jgi:hypothetical protein